MGNTEIECLKMQRLSKLPILGSLLILLTTEYVHGNSNKASQNLRIVPSFLYSAISPVYKALDYKMKSPAPGYPASTWPLIVDKAQTYDNIMYSTDPNLEDEEY